MSKKNFKVERVYNMADTFKELYTQGQSGKIFNNLYSLIIGENNILLAMKNVRTGIGRHTKGIDGKSIAAYEKIPVDKLIGIVKRRLNNFKPMKVKQIFIPKSNGTKRTLGILTFEDRLIQQCIRQILDPICESQFHPNSFGFRSLRSTKHAVGKMVLLTQMTKYDYCVDIDIENFFDNVNHEILINQIHNLGIHDKKLLAIISKMLKVSVQGERIKRTGLIQGSTLAPLLSNIVLNELDWWLNSQCQTANKLPADNKIFFVRYADDFKILCKTFSDAFKVFNAVRTWLAENLKLNISSEKSKIVNLRTQGSEFLGFKIKSICRDGVYFVESHISDNNKLKIQNNLSKTISRIGDDGKNAKKVLKDLNRQIATLHSYYQSADQVRQDFQSIGKFCQNLLDAKLKDIAKKVPFPDSPNVMTYKVDDVILIPMECVAHKKLAGLPRGANIYTGTGLPRATIAKVSGASMKKYRSTKKTSKAEHLEPMSLFQTIKQFVINFLYRMPITL